jgi:hypothetical protein
MNVLIVHLSDIHIVSDSDPIHGRVQAIAEAAGTIAYDVDACVMVVTGDIAYSGTDPQYTMAEILLSAIQRRLQEIINSRGSAVVVQLVVCPGNHDCDFSEPSQAREIVMESVSRNPNQARDASIANICLEVQDNFWRFADSLPPPGEIKNDSGFDDRLYREYVITTNGGTLRVRCCNTAFLSTKHEKQGTLVFPSDAVPQERTSDALSIAAFHHPYNWLEAKGARNFRKAVEKASDLVLTGHEHESASRSQSDAEGTDNTYVEGGVLQESGSPAASLFNAMVVDSSSKKQKFILFKWDGERYAATGTDEWRELRLNKKRAIQAFELSARTRAWIEDPEVTLSHPTVQDVRLADIYVFPDLREVTLPNQKGQFVSGNLLPDFVCEHRLLLITGDSQSGKTSLAKMLMLELLSRNEVPVFLDGSLAIPSNAEQLRKYIEDRFVDQYESAERDVYRHLDSIRRVVIVDNYERLRVPKRQRRRWLDALSEFSGRIVLIAHEVILDVEDMTYPESSSALPRYAIQPLGHARRDRLIEKWLLLDDNSDLGPTQFAHKLTSIARDLDSLIGKNFVPAYPPYVLSVVQATEAFSAVDTSAACPRRW